MATVTTATGIRPIVTATVIRLTGTAAIIGPTMAATTARMLALRWRGGLPSIASARADSVAANCRKLRFRLNPPRRPLYARYGLAPSMSHWNASPIRPEPAQISLSWAEATRALIRLLAEPQ